MTTQSSRPRPPRTATAIRLTPELHQRLEAAAAERDFSIGIIHRGRW